MSTHDIDSRLARLAPTGSPDPERFDAARAELEAAIADPHGPTAARSAPTTPGTSGASHRLDLDAHPDDAVVPLDAARRARRRRWSLTAAAAGLVGVTGAALLLLPSDPEPVPATPTSACAERLDAQVDSTGTGASPSWRLLAEESTGRSDVTIMLSESARLAGACTDVENWNGSTSRAYTWSLPGSSPSADDVLPHGVRTDNGTLVWGAAGDDVESIEVQTFWTDSDGAVSRGTGTSRQARTTDDGYWYRHIHPQDGVPPDAEIRLAWTLTDGTRKTLSLDDAWPGADATNALAEARRDECRSATSGLGSEQAAPVLEERRGDLGLTLYADEQRFRLCIQAAAPPYTTEYTGGAHFARGDHLVSGEAVALLGGGVTTPVLVGVASEDVSRVEVTTAAGEHFVAEVTAGFWAAWSTERLAADDLRPWRDATMRWYRADGSVGGEREAFSAVPPEAP